MRSIQWNPPSITVTIVGMMTIFAQYSVDSFAPQTYRTAPATSSATTPKPTISTLALQRSDDLDDFPSDSSADDIVDVDSTIVERNAPNEVLADSLLDDLPLTGEIPDERTRASINEVLLKMEASNPTPKPAQSLLMNGIWSLRYAGMYDGKGAVSSPTRQLALFLYSGGYSPGLFALGLAEKLPKALVEIGDLEIAISREQPRIEARVGAKLLNGGSNDVVVRARLEVQSDVRLTETYESVKVLGNDGLEIPDQLRYTRDLYITYLDQDVMVVRDGSGVPEVLVRKD